MTTYTDKIIDLENQIAVLKKRREEELKENEYEKKNPIDYNINKIKQILEWNIIGDFDEWPEEMKHNFRYPGGYDNFYKHIKEHKVQYRQYKRNIMVYGPKYWNGVYTRPSDEKTEELQKKYSDLSKEYGFGPRGNGIINSIKSIYISLNLINERLNNIEKNNNKK